MVTVLLKAKYDLEAFNRALTKASLPPFVPYESVVAESTETSAAKAGYWQIMCMYPVTVVLGDSYPWNGGLDHILF